MSKDEISEIETAISSGETFSSVNIHLNDALKFLSDRENPNYRNSVKESISSVESMCKILSNDAKATLASTLNNLEKTENLHPALKKAFSSLYGYTSDDGGIRHGLKNDDREIDFHEAKFMLVVCSSFINYLKSKMK